MRRLFRGTAMLAVVVAAAGCGTMRGGASPQFDAANTVLLEVKSEHGQALGINLLIGGSRRFVGSVGPRDEDRFLLDPWLFPAARFYVEVFTGTGTGAGSRYAIGPLSAARGERVQITIAPSLQMSTGVVVR